MEILLTNDDGYDAEGLEAAYEAVRGLGTVHVVAPGAERSACSHTITLGKPITVERRVHDKLGPGHAVDGSPADCVRLAVAELLDKPIDLVIAGINRGANAGVDTFYSGTIAAAREGAIMGITAIAVSQAIRRGLETDWTAATAITAALIKQLIDEKLPGPGYWNVNLPAPIPPNPAGHVHRVPVATHPTPLIFERTERDDGRVMEFGYRASYWGREVTAPTDYSTIRDGAIAVTPVPLIGRF